MVVGLSFGRTYHRTLCLVKSGTLPTKIQFGNHVLCMGTAFLNRSSTMYNKLFLFPNSPQWLDFIQTLLVLERKLICTCAINVAVYIKLAKKLTTKNLGHFPSLMVWQFSWTYYKAYPYFYRSEFSFNKWNCAINVKDVLPYPIQLRLSGTRLVVQ